MSREIEGRKDFRMGLLRRAFLYNKRKLGKSCILFLILFIMSLSVLTGLSIYRSSVFAIDSLRESFGGSFKIEAKYNKEDLSLWEAKESGGMSYIGPNVDDDLIENVMTVNGIKSYNASTTWYLYTDDLNLVSGMYGYQDSNAKLKEYVEPGDELWEKVSKFIGNTNSESSVYFRTGAYELVEGEHIGDGDSGKVLISQELANRNYLKVGDVFTVSMREGLITVSENLYKQVGSDLKLEVVGTFKVKSGIQASEMTPESEISDNIMFTSLDFSNQVLSYLEEENRFYESCTFFIQDPKALEDIINKVKSQNIVDMLYFNVMEDDATYKSSAAPLETIRLLIKILVVFVIVTCAILLCLLLTMWIKERIKETGILLSIGLSKKNIVLQYMLECVMIAVLAFGLSFVVSEGVAAQTGNYVLEKITPEEENTMKTITSEDIMNASATNTLDTTELVKVESPIKTPKSLTIRTGLDELLTVIFVGIVLICFSVYWAVSKEFKLNPKEILSKL